MKNFKFLCLMSIASLISVNGCGTDSAGTGSSTAAGVSGLVGVLSPGGVGLSLMREYRLAKKEAILQNQLLAAYAASPQDLSLCQYIETSASDFKIENDCTFSCTNSSSGFTVVTACNDVDSTETCGAEEYTLKDFKVNTTVAVTGLSGVDDFDTAEMSIDMDAEGQVTSPNLTGSVDCTMGFAMSLSDAADVADFDCADTNFSCTAGGKTYTCAELEAAQAASACNDSNLQ